MWFLTLEKMGRCNILIKYIIGKNIVIVANPGKVDQDPDPQNWNTDQPVGRNKKGKCQ